MKVLLAAIAAAFAVPIVSVAMRGTLDQQRVAAIRAGGRGADARPLATQDHADGPRLPGPRRSPETDHASAPSSTLTA